MKAISRIKKVIEKTEECFEGYYKNHWICITMEYICTGFEPIYHIEVQNQDGIYSYHGYWDGDNRLNLTMEDAVEEALKGSMLI